MDRRTPRDTASSALGRISWRRSNRAFLATFCGLLAATYLFVLLVDPYGVVPFSLPIERTLVSGQRQMYPQILRTGRYDSLLVGTSTSRLLDPEALDRVLGGHFASFAMPSMTAWEQFQAIDYFRRTVAVPKALLMGLDHEWCNESKAEGGRDEEFPSWAFSGNRWSALLYLLNSATLEVAGRTVGALMGLYPKKLRADGFEVFVPPDATYDAALARQHIWGPAHGPASGPRPPPLAVSEAERRAMSFPAMALLDQALAEFPSSTRKVLIFTPVHVAAQPAGGTDVEAMEAECKARVARIAQTRGAILVDWRIPSPLTSEDTNYWDMLHYRLPIAYRLIDDLGHAVNEGRGSPDGSYRILVR